MSLEPPGGRRRRMPGVRSTNRRAVKTVMTMLDIVGEAVVTALIYEDKL